MPSVFKSDFSVVFLKETQILQAQFNTLQCS